jgi:hypothetical protein
MLGVETPLKYRKKKDGIQVTLPRVLPGRLPSEYIWTLKISSAR